VTPLVERVAKLWAENKSQRAIAVALGRSRGQISGLVDRARKRGDGRFQPRPRAPGQSSRSRRRRAQAQKAADTAVTAPPVITPAVIIPPVIKAASKPPRRLVDLNYDECRFSCEEIDGIHYFCGRPGYPWCLDHRPRIYSAPRISTPGSPR
jgi:hypothetical protein